MGHHASFGLSWPGEPEVVADLTMDEAVAFGLAIAALLSLIATLLYQLLLGCLSQFSCLESYLLALEVNAEVGTLDRAVQSAYKRKPPGERSAIDAAMRTPQKQQQQRQQSPQQQRGQHGGKMDDYAPVLILAEAKAATSKLDDHRKTFAKPPPGSGGKGGKAQRSSGYGKRSSNAGGAKSRRTIMYPGNGVYEGEYINGVKEGRGKFWYVEGTVYEGEWHADQKHGDGKETYSDGAVYIGAFSQGSREGLGALTYANKDKYEGEWMEDIKHGEGTFTWVAGTRYEGDFEDGVMHGQGMYTFADGCQYVGSYADGKRNGRGVYRFVDGSYFEGEYRDGVVEGRGTFTFADGSTEVGRWEDGRPVGEATRFSPDHKKAWRLFDGHVTGPVSLDLGDVIAQMAFRPKAARLARAVRDSLQAVKLEAERKRIANATPGMQKRSARSAPGSPQATERPQWMGVLDIAKKELPKVHLSPTAAMSDREALDAGNSRSSSPWGFLTGGGGGGGSGAAQPYTPPRSPIPMQSSPPKAYNAGFPTWASMVTPKSAQREPPQPGRRPASARHISRPGGTSTGMLTGLFSAGRRSGGAALYQTGRAARMV